MQDNTLTGTLKGDASCHCSTDDYRDGWDRIYAEKEDWAEEFITQEGGEYFCWDETQSHMIGTAADKEEALDIVHLYAEYLAALGLNMMELSEEIG